MDCFFVSVGLRKFPHLRGKAVAVTHAKNTDERNNRNDTNVKAEFNLYRKRREVNIPLLLYYVYLINLKFV